MMKRLLCALLAALIWTQPALAVDPIFIPEGPGGGEGGSAARGSFEHIRSIAPGITRDQYNAMSGMVDRMLRTGDLSFDAITEMGPPMPDEGDGATGGGQSVAHLNTAWESMTSLWNAYWGLVGPVWQFLAVCLAVMIAIRIGIH